MGCDYLYIEANHQPSMVHASARPMVYKQRVLGRSGHLSNEACGNLIRDILNAKLKHVHLAHLSEECNCPKTAMGVIEEILAEMEHRPEISIAPQRGKGRPIFFES